MDSSQDIKVVRARIGSNIGRLREQRGWTQADFARRIGKQPTYINEVESGKRNPTVGNYYRIARGLEVPLSSLFEGVDRP